MNHYLGVLGPQYAFYCEPLMKKRRLKNKTNGPNQLSKPLVRFKGEENMCQSINNKQQC